MFKVGDLVLLRTKELLDAADIGKLRPRWDGPFPVIACPSPNAYTLALPRKMRCSLTVNVDRLKPFSERAGAAPAPGPVSDAGQEGEHEVELLLNRRLVRGVMRHLVRWRGHTSESTTSGCGRRSWHTARRRWRSTTPRTDAVARPAGRTRQRCRLRRRSHLRPRPRRPSCRPQVSGSQSSEGLAA